MWQSILKTTKSQRILLIVLLLLFVTNPSQSTFSSFTPRPPYPFANYGRRYNFYVCSIYWSWNNEYLGIFGNFIDITPKPVPEPEDTIKESQPDKPVKKQADPLGILPKSN